MQVGSRHTVQVYCASIPHSTSTHTLHTLNSTMCRILWVKLVQSAVVSQCGLPTWTQQTGQHQMASQSHPNRLRQRTCLHSARSNSLKSDSRALRSSLASFCQPSCAHHPVWCRTQQSYLQRAWLRRCGTWNMLSHTVAHGPSDTHLNNLMPMAYQSWVYRSTRWRLCSASRTRRSPCSTQYR